MATSPFDLGQILQTAEAIKGMRRRSVLDDLQQQYLGQRMTQDAAAEQRAVAQESRDATKFDQTQQVENTKLLNMAAAEMAQNPSAITRWLPQLKQAGVFAQDFDPSTMTPEDIQQSSAELFASTSEALKAYGGNTQNNVQSTQILDNGNLGLVMRDGTVRDTGQAVKPQVLVRDVGGVPTAVTTTGGRTTTAPLSTLEQEAGAAGTIAGAEAGAKATATAAADQQKEQTANQRTLEVWRIAREGLVSALAGTETGPITGRVPAVTSGQQIAEGAVASVAPVLKQLFRSAGEGIFTDRDQALLLEMVPKRTDHPETITAKMEMIDAIIQAKLSTPSAAPDSGGWTVEEIK